MSAAIWERLHVSDEIVWYMNIKRKWNHWQHCIVANKITALLPELHKKNAKKKGNDPVKKSVH